MTIDDILQFRESCIAENPSDDTGRFVQVAELDIFSLKPFPYFVYRIEDTVSSRELDITEYIDNLTQD